MANVRRTVGVIGALGVIGLVGACSPPSGLMSTEISVCTPIDALWDHLDITFESVPEGSDLLFSRAHEFWIDGHLDDVVVEDRTFVAGSTAIPGRTVSVGAAQRGRCVHLAPHAGLTFRYTPVWTTDPLSYFVNEGYMGGFHS